MLRLIPWMVLSFTMFFLVQIINLIPAYMMSYLVDVIIPKANIHLIIMYVILYISIPFASGLGNSIYVYYTAVKCRKCALELNKRIFENLLSQNMLFYVSNPGGELAAKVMQDVSDYVYLWICTIPQAISSVLSIGAIFIIIGKINIYIAIVQALFIILLLLPVRTGGKIVSENSKKLFGAIVKARYAVSEAFSGILTVKAMSLEKKILNRYVGIYKEGNSIFGRAVAVETIVTSGIRDFLSAVFLGIAFIQCAVYVSSGMLTIGLLITCISVLPRYYSLVVNLVSADLSFKKQVSQYNDLFRYLNLETEFLGEDMPTEFLSNELKLVDVDFKYDNEKVLSNVCLTLKKGKWIGIEGKSGAGKTTLINILIGLYIPDSGVMTIDGLSVKNLKLNWYRTHIAYVPQDPFLFNGTIRENVELFCGDIDSDKINESLKKANIYDFVNNLPNGLDSYIGENGLSISGGEKQRLAIAIALMTNRPLLVLDEATSNMDSFSQEYVRDNLKSLVDNEALTIISVSHRKDFHKCIDLLYEL